MVLFQDVCVQGEVDIVATGIHIYDSMFTANLSNSEGSSPFTIHSICSDIRIVGCSFNGVGMNITVEMCNQGNPENSIILQDSVVNGVLNDVVVTERCLLSLTLSGARVEVNNCLVTGGLANGIYSQLNNSMLTITNSSVTNNSNGGIYIVTLSAENHVVMEDVNITSNSLQDSNNGNPYKWTVPNGAGFSICPHGDFTSIEKTYSIVLRRVHFENNQDKNSVPKILFLYIPHNVSIFHSRFLSNKGSAVSVYLTDHFTIGGNTEFVDNSGYEGGALQMHETYLTVADNSNVMFRGNHATNAGGAIWLNDFPLQIDESQKCFYQLNSPYPNASLIFEDNRASKRGDHIYGATTKSPCSAYTHHSAYPDIFHFDPGFKASLSCVSSNPMRVCLCDERSQKQCADMDYIFSTKECYPGEEIVLHAVVVGADFGAIAGSVIANSSNSLAPLEYSQRVESTRCQQLNYTIHAKENTSIVMGLHKDYLELNDWYQNAIVTQRYVENYQQNDVIDINLLSVPVYISISVKACPAGFKFDTARNVCDCDSRLLINEKVSCSIHDGAKYISRTSALWVSASNNGGVKFNTKCPRSRCADESSSVNLGSPTPSNQCQPHRTGTICGQCEVNYSLTLGTLECWTCPKKNLHLLLLLSFAVTGIAWVLFVKLLDLTVADGFINGLVFYCNIVWINKDILLPPEKAGTGFLRIFLAWFNLDLGITTCFFDGLDMYTYTWLQYVFPAYVLAISVSLVFIGKRINLLGGNAPQVLATLLLLCYYKLLNVIVSSLRFATVTVIHADGEESDTTVWEADGSIRYLTGTRHAFLFVAAILVLLIVCAPYTFLLLTRQHLNRSKSRWMRQLLLKLMPLTDAYSGPFKPRKEYWVGVLLLARVVLLVVSSVTFGTNSAYNNMALIMIITFLLLYKAQVGRLYRTLYLSLMENILFANLIALAVTCQMSEIVHRLFREVFAFALVALAFLQFLILVAIKVVWVITQRFPCCLSRNESTPLLDRSLEVEHTDRTALGTSDVFLKWLDSERRNSTAEKQL